MLIRSAISLLLPALLIAASGCAGRTWYGARKKPPPIYVDTLPLNPPPVR